MIPFSTSGFTLFTASFAELKLACALFILADAVRTCCSYSGALILNKGCPAFTTAPSSTKILSM